MDDFIRPKQINNEPKKKKKLKYIRTSILMVVCLATGFFAGTMIKDEKQVGETRETDVVDEVYTTLRDYWVSANDQGDFEDLIVDGMVTGLDDPHSEHFTVEEAEDFNDNVSGNFQGIGVGISVVYKGAMITKVYDNSPAQTAGLQVGDILTKADDTSLEGMDSDTIVDHVRGEEGTSVKLTVIRGTETLEIDVTRAAIDTSTFYEIRSEGDKKFGYIELETFGTETPVQVKAALDYFKEEGVEILVLDLRDNGGGYLIAAESILSLFFTSDEVIYQIQEKNKAAEKYYASGEEVYEFETGYILANGNTASASELTAGALQSEKGFKLIGEQTYGKGTAQTQKTLSDGSVLKYTYAKWMIPDGTCIDGTGLTPDIEVANDSIDDISTEEIEETLKYDCVSTKVASMQKMLYILGYSVDRQDGYFSNGTVETLKQFETDNNLEVNGEYDDNDKQMLVSRVLIYLNNHENDKQYEKLLQIIR